MIFYFDIFFCFSLLCRWSINLSRRFRRFP